MTTRPNAPVRRPYFVWLIVAGALAIIAGITWGLIAKASAERSALSPGEMPTLPVHEYVQYTQRAIVPDYLGLWIGFLIAAIGAILLLAGAAAAFTRSRVA